MLADVDEETAALGVFRFSEGWEVGASLNEGTRGDCRWEVGVDRSTGEDTAVPAALLVDFLFPSVLVLEMEASLS